MSESVYKRYCDQLAREDDLLKSRITSLIGFQGFLIASLTFSGSQNIDSKLKVYIMDAMPALGIVCGLVSLITIFLGNKAVNLLHQQWVAEDIVLRPSPFGLQVKGKGYIANYFNGPSIIVFSSIMFWIFSYLTRYFFI